MTISATDQKESQTTFLEKVIEKSSLKTTNSAQVATKVVFRLLRDLMPNDEINRIEQALQSQPPKANMQVADLWNDLNVMIAFFSRISPIQQLSISSKTFLLRLKQEGELPQDADAKVVTQAIFSATKDELPQQRISEIAQFLPDEIRQLWEQA